MLSTEVSTASGQPLRCSGSAMHASSIRFTTPPRRHNPAFSAEAELTVLTAGASLAHEELYPGNTGSRALNCTPADSASGCKSNSSVATAAVVSADVSPRRCRGGPSFASIIFGDVDSPCGSPRVRLTRPCSSFCSFAKPTLCGSLPSSAAPSCKVRDGALVNRSSSGLHGVSPSFSMTTSEAEEDATLASAESVLVPTSVEPVAPLRSIALAANDARPPSSPSFTYFPGGGGGSVLHESAAPSSKKSSTVGAKRSFRFGSVHCTREGCAASLNSNSSTEPKVFEPLRFDASDRLFSPLQRVSAVEGSQRGSCVSLEPRALDGVAASLGHQGVANASPLLSAQQCKLCEIVKQQQLLHACLVSIARERNEWPDSQRSRELPLLNVQQKHIRGSRLLSIMWLLCTVFLRLPLRIIARVLTVSAEEFRKLLVLPRHS
ncbi:hypothetical protein JIQ42_01529 [Leishmania sp. Namibia]|uniref:hypothetical protein n=1 Tax=Leishmania sp. Namibia TaxID=2802991 RepID=UPI001B43858F|nr:hypothetical protein JIQ42_01529 [Leishmania sp. Namibia]